MKSLSIALMHYSCPPVVGGVEEVVRQQASLFHRHFHKVKIFAGAGARFTEEYPVEINPLLSSRHPRVQRAHQKLLEGNPTGVEKLARDIYQYLSRSLSDFDVLIAHNILTMRYNLPLTLAVLRLAEEHLLPVVSWNHDSPYFYPDIPDHLFHPPWNVLHRVHPHVFYVAISESRRQQFQDIYGKDCELTVIPNGVDPIRFFRLDPSTVRLIQEEALFLADFLLVQPSRLHPRKNIELSIRVTRALQDQGLGARLLVSGAYDPHEPKTVAYYRHLMSLARELNVQKDVLIMAEYTFRSGEKLTADRITMRDLYLIADVLFLPSLQEGFGIPLLEAGMIKLPVVCSSIPPFQEIGEQDVCLFNPEEPPAAIAEKLTAFLRRIPTQRFFRRVIHHYSWDNIYAFQLKPFLQKVVERFYQRTRASH